MKTADRGTDLGECAADLGVILELTLFIVTEHTYLRSFGF